MVLIKCRGQGDYLTTSDGGSKNPFLEGKQSTWSQYIWLVVLIGSLGGRRSHRKRNTIDTQFLFWILHRNPSSYLQSCIGVPVESQKFFGRLHRNKQILEIYVVFFCLRIFWPLQKAKNSLDRPDSPTINPSVAFLLLRG